MEGAKHDKFVSVDSNYVRSRRWTVAARERAARRRVGPLTLFRRIVHGIRAQETDVEPGVAARRVKASRVPCALAFPPPLQLAERRAAKRLPGQATPIASGAAACSWLRQLPPSV